MTIYNEMRARRPDLLPYLFEGLHTDRRGEVPAGQKPWHDIPVFNWHEGYLSVLYARRYIESARRFPEIAELTDDQRAALDLFDDLHKIGDKLIMHGLVLFIIGIIMLLHVPLFSGKMLDNIFLQKMDHPQGLFLGDARQPVHEEPHDSLTYSQRFEVLRVAVGQG